MTADSESCPILARVRVLTAKDFGFFYYMHGYNYLWT